MAREPNTTGVTFSKDFDAGGFEVGSLIFSEARNGHREIVGEPPHEPVFDIGQLVRIHAKQLLSTIIFRDVVKMIQKRLRAPADTKAPEAVRPRPLKYLRQFRPVGHILERQPLDRCAGDDQRVKKLVSNIVEPAVEAPQIAWFCMPRCVGSRRHQDQFDL